MGMSSGGLCRALSEASTGHSRATLTATMLRHQRISQTPALRAVLLDGMSEDLEDLVFLESIVATDKIGEDFATQASALFERIECVLGQHGMVKSHIVDVKSTFTELGADLIKWNALYDKWMNGVEIVPTQTAFQLRELDASMPRIAVSLTATKAPKQKVGSSRAGNGEPAMMVPSKDSSYPAQPIHLPWSNVIKAGNVAWVAGFLDVQQGADMSLQLKGVTAKIDAALAEVGMKKNDIISSEILVPVDLSEQDFAQVDANYVNQYLSDNKAHKVAIHRVCKTCAGAKVEITVLASKSQNVLVLETPTPEATQTHGQR